MKFADDLVLEVLDGEKDHTVRLADEWGHLRPGDPLSIDDEDGTPVGSASVVSVGKMTAFSSYAYVADEDGYRSFSTRGAYLNTLAGYYDDEDLPEWPATPVVVIRFGGVEADPDTDPRDAWRLGRGEQA